MKGKDFMRTGIELGGAQVADSSTDAVRRVPARAPARANPESRLGFFLNWKLLSSSWPTLRATGVASFAAAFAAALGASGAPVGDLLRTPAEVSGYTATPSYEETLSYLDRLSGDFPS